MARFLAKAFRYILVYRKSDIKPKDYSTQQEITNRVNEAYDMKHANDTPYAPLVFPEGTTSSGKQVTRFHRGVFVAGKPIRPFTINYPSQHFSNNYDAVSTIRLAYGILTQFYNKFEMHVYDLYIPNEQERNNPDLYAENVGKFIAGKLNKPYVDSADLRTSELVCHILVDNKYKPEEIDDEIAKLDQIKSQERQIHNDKIVQSRENTDQPNILLQD
ncbi:MAG: putative lysophospholipid acyltransferase LPEAT1 [Streblomastix strix]|uniref:Putative lysophospholipid acyltransferase LPEAT1 n=1 Tax=Streblomastix strix TaxID=222440 RepID=A0A5J4XA16_9EUKA|nr:MAG: putative lysophospholipid acyltransferase LPEAT1 [Streblomastix strix]KAA6404161.1 MAG: putative lysophospholipid acyltransferase LPEAT1 [Streblomastix strix]